MSDGKIGVAGLGVMGQNLALNIEEKGFPVAVYDRVPEVVDRFARGAAGKQVRGCRGVAELVGALERPRRIIMMIKAGEPTDLTIGAIAPHLERGDMLVDGGNAYFRDTERRGRTLERDGFRYLGMGVSGGAEGARRGPSLMPGGQRDAFEHLAPILRSIAAQVDDGPCCEYMGPDGAGHYVKMVHNGIEYGDMQLIAEAYDMLRTIGGLGPRELQDTFAAWNQGELESYLVEITAQILGRRDQEGEHLLLDVILDAAGMKGTGSWTVAEAAQLAVAVPTIAAAVDARALSAMKEERVAASKLIGGPPSTPAPPVGTERDHFVDDVRSALYAAKICSYAQGMALLRRASDAYGWSLPLAQIARIWKGGCIIRAGFLNRIRDAYARDPGLPNLLVDPDFRADLTSRQEAWRRVIGRAVAAGAACPAMAAALGYYDTYRRERLPANLIQAQRDYFGAHTYRRIDRDGVFHTEWADR